MNRDVFLKFFKILKEALLAYAFDILGIVSGVIIAFQLNVFQLAPWTFAVYPAILSARGVVTGMMSGRLSTALNIGTIYPRFFGNTRLFSTVIEAIEVATFETSVVMGLLGAVFGGLFLGVGRGELLNILIVILGTMSFGIVISIVTIIASFFSYKTGLDPDVTTYPMTSSVADIIITLAYIFVLNMFFLFGAVGKSIVLSLGIMFLIITVYFIMKNFREEEFIKTIKESFLALVFVAIIVNVTGLILGRVSEIVGTRKEIYTVYPALIDTVGDVGAVVGSLLTTKLALGSIEPTFTSIRNHVVEILAAWLASIAMFVVYSFLALMAQGNLSIFFRFTSLLLAVNGIAVAGVVVISYASAILTFKKRLDPDNFVIPIESSLADTLTSLSLFIVLIVF
jgi:mgtE-like transporter